MIFSETKIKISKRRLRFTDILYFLNTLLKIKIIRLGNNDKKYYVTFSKLYLIKYVYLHIMVLLLDETESTQSNRNNNKYAKFVTHCIH